MKRTISLLLCLVMLVSMFAVSTGAAQYNPEKLDSDNFDITQTILKDKTFTLGDANGDKAFNAQDSLCLKLALTGNIIEGYSADAADFTADGKIASTDSYYMRACLSGKINASALDSSKQLYKFLIGDVNISEFSIVIPTDAVYDSNLYYATELLYEYIKLSTGVDLAIERGTASGSNAIYLHHVEDDSELGAELGHEGYKYIVENGSLHIYGTHRGCMYAAYEIIEDYLGYSFFSNAHTFSYKKRCVSMEEGLERTHVPTYRFRHTKSTFPSGNRECGYLARGLNGTQAYNYKNEKRSLEYYGDFVGPVFNNIHSYAYYWQMGTGIMPDESYGTLEERYFAKLQSGEPKDETTWEPCVTNETDYETIFEGFVDTIRMIEARGYPIKYQDGTNCYSFSANDNDNWCTCRKCNLQIKAKTRTGIALEFANRGARDIQAYYPGLKVFTWIYTRETPVDVLPDENLVIVLAGFNCANHHLGGEGDDTCTNGSFFGFTNKVFEDRIDAWDAMCKQTGAEIWLWYYPETHYFWLYDIPNIYTIYHDVTWLNQHGVSGFFYEGSGGRGYMFENLKAYLASQVMFDPTMTLEEYDEHLKSYLYECYGRGWKNIYKLIQMYEEAGDAVGFEGGNQNSSYCYIGNYDRAYDMVSIAYVNEHYEEMRDLILAAISENNANHDTTNTNYTAKKLNDLFNAFEILGLGATYLDHYVNGTDAQKAEYERRYTDFLNYYWNNGMTVSSYEEYNSKVPSTVDLSVGNPAYYFFPGGSRRLTVTNLMGEDPTA